MESHSRAHHEKELITEEGINIFDVCVKDDESTVRVFCDVCQFVFSCCKCTPIWQFSGGLMAEMSCDSNPAP